MPKYTVPRRSAHASSPKFPGTGQSLSGRVDAPAAGSSEIGPSRPGPQRAPRRMPNRLEQQLYDLMGDDFEPFKDEEKIRMYGSVERCNAIIDSQIPPGKKLDVVGMRPKPGETDDVHLIPLPNSGDLCLRVFPGGFQGHGQYFIEFYDRVAQRSMKAPPGCEFLPAYRPGAFLYPGRLVSWQKTWGTPMREDITEYYAVPEGSLWELRRRGKPHFSFAIPTRPQPAFAQAVPIIRF